MDKYKGLVLDQFQIDALNAINDELSVIVSAPTGTGKTLVADYLVEKSLNSNKRIIYTAQLKP
jgi:superfamily II RNA helicase